MYYDNESQHRSFIKAATHHLSDEQLGALWNGVGSSYPLLRWADDLIPKKYKRCMLNASKYHDVAYYLGGTEAHRKVADELFYRVTLDSMCLRLLPEELKYAKMWDNLAYYVLRFGAQASFDYRDKPLTIAELKALADKKIEEANK